MITLAKYRPALCEDFDTPLLTAAKAYPNLVDYADRIGARFCGKEQAEAA